MSDRREEILNKHDSSRKYIEQTCRPELFAAMDEYMSESCLKLLEYMAENRIESYVNSAGEPVFYIPRRGFDSEFLCKNELFENFL